MRGLSIMLIVTVLTIAIPVHAEESLALSANYAYSTLWPGTPNALGDTTPPSILTDGNLSNLVIEAGGEILLVYFDLGQDYDLKQLKVFATNTAWKNNALSSIRFFVSADASDGFSGDWSTISTEAKWKTDVAVDKTDPNLWVVDTGAIKVTGRYLAIWANGDSNPTNAIAIGEVQVFGSKPAVALNNAALGASYGYSMSWPSRPSVWPDRTTPSILTDGDDGTNRGPEYKSNSVYEKGNEILLAFFDLGRDYNLVQLKALATQSDWNNNALSSINFFVSTEAKGRFSGSYAGLSSEATWMMTGITVNKVGDPNAYWVGTMDTGPINTTGRYLAIWANGDGVAANTIGLSEVQAFTMPQVCGDLGVEYSAYDLTGPQGVSDCIVDFYDFAAMATAWLECTTPNKLNCGGWYNE